MKNEVEGGVNILSLSIDGLFKEAKHAVEKKNEARLSDIEKLVKRFFCHKISRHQLEEFDQFNKQMVNFLTWFEWGGEPKWDKAVSIANKWKTILELSQLISRTGSPRKAYQELKKSSYGERLVALLYEKKFMRPSEIQEYLKIGTIQQVSKLLSGYEKNGIIVREIVGKNVWVSLGVQGIAVYNEYIEPRLPNMSHLNSEAFKIYDRRDSQKAKELDIESNKINKML
jgi:predicted DNA-binding transcriptional regulator